ncbi:peptidoglycan-associated lipoprotein Pal [Ideonella sp. DXS22W]|uniref:Peptidoglycan-associated lipoprotein n=1 Tax=Pseudaquabacterium inlustre TaxID=2984192 RepID=A0ABU9CDA7_9BURK
MNLGLRATGLATFTAAVTTALLTGCGSTVKLDETPVETRTPTAVPTATAPGTPAAGAGGSAGAVAPQSKVATVDLSRSAPGAGAAAGAGAGAAAAASNLARVVYFDFDSFVVKDDFRGMLEAHAKALNATKGKRLTVEGHTDERGGSEYNIALGQKRAEAVVKTLALLGVPEAQLEAVSFGKERPADPGHDEAAWAKNRRAELKDR